MSLRCARAGRVDSSSQKIALRSGLDPALGDCHLARPRPLWACGCSRWFLARRRRPSKRSVTGAHIRPRARRDVGGAPARGRAVAAWRSTPSRRGGRVDHRHLPIPTMLLARWVHHELITSAQPRGRFHHGRRRHRSVHAPSAPEFARGSPRRCKREWGGSGAAEAGQLRAVRRLAGQGQAGEALGEDGEGLLHLGPRQLGPRQK